MKSPHHITPVHAGCVFWFAFWRASACAIIFVALAACGATPTIVEQRVVDGLTISLERPAQPIALRDYAFVATITDADDQPVEATLVYFDFTMPQMEMGVHQPSPTGLVLEDTGFAHCIRWKETGALP